MTQLMTKTSVTGQFQKPIVADSLPLYPFQQETVNFMVSAGSCVNANFVGSGKSLTTLAVCQKLDARRVLIITPKSVASQWALIEIPKWMPNASIQLITGTLKQRQKQYETLGDHQFTIAGYETVRSDIAHISKHSFDIVICDEAHRLASVRTKLYKSLAKLTASHRYALTATPVMNRPDDLFGIINWVKPGALGSWWGFINRYCVKGGFENKIVVGYRHLDELARRCEPYIIKKTLDEVGMQLPPYTEEELPVILSPIERQNYNLIKNEALLDIEQHIINKIDNPAMMQNTVVKITRLFELCDSLELLGELKASSKLETLKEHLEGTITNDQKAIIITRFSRMAGILQRNLEAYNPCLITGSTQNRAEIIRAFEEGDHQLLIGTEAIGQGLNLQVANILYNYDSAWNPARMEQRAGRIYRNGQTRPVFIYNLVCQKTIEVWLQKKLLKKQELSDSLLPKTITDLQEMLEDD